MDEKQPVRLRMLGAALRRYRLERGFSLDDAAAGLPRSVRRPPDAGSPKLPLARRRPRVVWDC